MSVNEAIGPSHYLEYASRHRSYQWFSLLVNQWNQNYPEHPFLLDSRLKQFFPFENSFGFTRPYPLETILDDTPVSSFLYRLSEEISTFEEKFFKRLLEKKEALDIFEAHTKWFGRKIAQEYLVSNYPLSGSALVEPAYLFDAINQVLESVTQAEKTLIFRRVSKAELEYEHKLCPHVLYADKNTAQIGCKMRAKLFHGFIEAITNVKSYQRTHFTSYCVDTVHF